MNDPGNKSSADNDPKAPQVNTEEQGIITNSDETNEAVNKDGVVADMDGIEETLSGAEPSMDLNVDTSVTNNDTIGGHNSDTAL
jgi:hypothetical protein